MTETRQNAQGQSIVIGLLTLIAIVLGSTIARQNPSWFNVLKTTSSNPTPSKSLPKSALVPPSPNASGQEKKEFFEAVRKAAEEVTTLELTDCKAKPMVLKVKNNTNLLIKNISQVGHRIVLYKKDYFIGPNDQQTVLIQTDRTPSIYGIGCDSSSSGPTGFVLILGNEQ